MANTIKIGHASHPEGSGVNGVAGDPSGKEVLIVEKYRISGRNYHTVLRPKDPVLAEKSALACEAGCKNNNIGYSQFGPTPRHTLYNEAKKVKWNLSKITTKCNTDCSAFMYTCATAGGAKISGGPGGPATSYMVTAYKNSGYYNVLKDKIYFSSADYLRRGDILVRKGHTIMILANGSKSGASITPPYIPPNDSEGIPQLQEITVDEALLNYYFIKIGLNITKITPENLEASAKLVSVSNGEEKDLDKTNIDKYKWNYTLSSLNSSSKTITKSMKVDNSNIKLSLSGLTPNSPYSLKITAIENNESKSEYNSPTIIFSTPQDFPTPVRNLVATFEETDELFRKCKISFNSPEHPGKLSSTKGYRTCLIVNGKIAAYNDSIFKATVATTNSKTIKLSDFKVDFNFGDVIQIGILPWINEGNGVIYDIATLACSQPYYITPALTMIDKIFVKIENEFKQTAIFFKQ